jgi:hypothetical protein
MTITLHPFTSRTSTLGYSVNSSAISKVAVVSTDSGTYDLLVIFTSSTDKVYRYTFEDDGAARRWNDLLNDDESRNATSWGYEFNRALRHGDIELI